MGRKALPFHDGHTSCGGAAISVRCDAEHRHELDELEKAHLRAKVATMGHLFCYSSATRVTIPSLKSNTTGAETNQFF